MDKQSLLDNLEEIIFSLRNLGLTENDIQYKVTMILDEWGGMVGLEEEPAITLEGVHTYEEIYEKLMGVTLEDD